MKAIAVIPKSTTQMRHTSTVVWQFSVAIVTLQVSPLDGAEKRSNGSFARVDLFLAT